MLRLDINIVWTILNLLIIFAIVKIFLIDRVNLLSVGESQKIPCYELAQIVFS